jgi:hypothetical protein
MDSNERRSENLESEIDGQYPSDSVTFIDVLFAVVMSLGLAKIMTRPWFKPEPEGAAPAIAFEILVILIGYLTLLLSWWGYHRSMLVGISPIHKEKKDSEWCDRPSHIRSRHTDLGWLLAALGDVRELLVCIMCPVGHISHVRYLGLPMVAETATRKRPETMAEACGYNPLDGTFRSYFCHLPTTQPLWFSPCAGRLDFCCTSALGQYPVQDTQRASLPWATARHAGF